MTTTHAPVRTHWSQRHETLMWAASLVVAHWRTLMVAGVFVYLLLAP